jgi:hypothetical protein
MEAKRSTAKIMGFFITIVLTTILSQYGCDTNYRDSLDMQSLKRNDVNIYINDHKINYYRSTIEDVQRAFGRKGSVFGNYRIDYRTFQYADFTGILVHYEKETGRIGWIQITRKGVELPGGIGVGDSRSSVEAILKNGICRDAGYMFLLEAADGTYGDGYVIKYDNKERIVEISFGRVAHEP